MGEKMESFKLGLDVMLKHVKQYLKCQLTNNRFIALVQVSSQCFPRYVLVFIIFQIHMIFWWGATTDGPSGEGGLNSFLSIVHGLSDLFGITGFFVLMLFITWCNNFVNFSTSGRWYTVSLLLNIVDSGFFFIEWVYY